MHTSPLRAGFTAAIATTLTLLLLAMPIPAETTPSPATDDELARTILEDARLDEVVRMGHALLASGMSAGSGYSEVWIRDLNTFIVPLLDVAPRDSVREALLVFFHFQGEDGNIIDGYVPKEKGHVGYNYRFADTRPALKAHKNTVETDQESSLVQAVCRYIRKTGDRTILDEVVRDIPVRKRIELALEYPLTHRFSGKHGLVWGATTADWGDVQPEHTWGVELDENSHRSIDIYDNALLLVAIDDYLHTVCTRDGKQMEKWAARHSSLREAVREHLWDGTAGKFIPHIYLDGSPFPADFDESQVFYHGGTAVAIEAGLLGPAEIATSLRMMRENVAAANAATIGLTLHPPYPAGSFKNAAMRPYCYQNGGDWTWFGARMVRQLAANGLHEDSYRELAPMLDRVLKHDGFFEWWTPGNEPRGSGSFRGSAGVLIEAIHELQTWARNELRVVWFDAPAPEWRYGLPVGNGRLGAMVQGTFPKERIQLNEDSIWAKEPMARHPETTKDWIAKVQTLVEAGKYREAHDIYEKEIIEADAGPVGSYQTMGDLWVQHVGNAKAAGGYRRQLDTETGLVTVTQPLTDGSVITQEVLSSAIDQCIAVRLTTTAADGLAFDVGLTRPLKTSAPALVRGNDTLLLTGQARYEDRPDPHLGTKFQTLLKAMPEDGRVTGKDGTLAVRGAKAVTLLLTCTTDFNRTNTPRIPLPDGWEKKAESQLTKAQAKTWKQIRDAACADVSAMINRCDVDLGTSAPELTRLPTDRRLAEFKRAQSDPDLLELYFQFGRYLQVSSSRPGTLPTNLQGMWAEGIRNPWSCDYHLNINIQLHYLSTEVTNLSECHEPVFWLLDMLRVEGRRMAAAYGAKGFCTNHDTNPWGRTISQARRARWGGSVIAVHWVVCNIMEHYRFTQDTTFLRESGLPILKESAEFAQSWLVRDPQTGQWVPRAGTSHETGFHYIGADGKKVYSEIGPVTAYDQTIIWQVMSDYLEAAAILKIDDAFTQSIQTTLGELEFPRISKEGHILEWGIENAVAADPHHRHLSHLIGLHPGNQITKRKTPEHFAAARESLLQRGNRTMGWSQSWKTSMFARLYDGNAALGQFKQLLSEQTQPNLFNLAGGILNLDGNYGTPAGVAEMLVQSHDGEIHLLPALPDEWKEGTARGIVARGGFVVDVGWKDGQFSTATILSRHGGPLRVRIGDRVEVHETTPTQRVVISATAPSPTN